MAPRSMLPIGAIISFYSKQRCRRARCNLLSASFIGCFCDAAAELVYRKMPTQNIGRRLANFVFEACSSNAHSLCALATGQNVACS